MPRRAWRLLLSATVGAVVCGSVCARAGDLTPIAPPPGPPPEPPELAELAPVPPKTDTDLLRLGGAVSIWARGFPVSPLYEGQRSYFPYFEGWFKADYEW